MGCPMEHLEKTANALRVDHAKKRDVGLQAIALGPERHCSGAIDRPRVGAIDSNIAS